MEALGSLRAPDGDPGTGPPFLDLRAGDMLMWCGGRGKGMDGPGTSLARRGGRREIPLSPAKEDATEGMGHPSGMAGFKKAQS